MSHRLFQPDSNARTSEEWSRLIREAQAAWDKRFAEASEEEQMLLRQVGRISFAYGLTDHDSNITKEEVARSRLLDTFGPKFTERVLKDATCRKVLGLKDIVQKKI